MLFVLGLCSLAGSHILSAQCSMTVSDLMPCAGAEVQFSVAMPQSGSVYAWDFDGDGQADSTGTEVSYVFPLSQQTQTYEVTLLQDGLPCAVQSVEVMAVPDVAVGLVGSDATLTGNAINACNNVDLLHLTFFNASQSVDSTLGYTIIWGDGSDPEYHPVEEFSGSDTLGHTYTAHGYFTIYITAEGVNGCVFTQPYILYNGGNPSVGLSNPGNTVGLCAPATVSFPITDVANNPPGTEYTLYLNGMEIAHYTQDSLPDAFVHTFEESSCGWVTSTGNYQDAFDISIVASNPCASSTATIEPISVSEPPEMMMQVNGGAGSIGCSGQITTISNATINYNQIVNQECIDVLNPTWTILGGTEGTDWVLEGGNIYGSQSIDVNFITPGVYTVEMTFATLSCGEFTDSVQIEVLDGPPLSGGPDLSLDSLSGGGGGGCLPLLIDLALPEDSTAEYQWQITPSEGWTWVSGSDSTGSISIEFTEGGTYDFSLTASNACAEVSWDTTLLIQGPPRITLLPLPDFCSSAVLDFDASMVSVLVNADSLDFISWSFPGGQPSSSSDLYPTGIVYDQPGQYEVQLMVGNACGQDTAAVSFTVQDLISLNPPLPSEACDGDTYLALPDISPAGGQWWGPGLINGDHFDPSAVGAGTYTLFYSYGVASCADTTDWQVTVHQGPVVQAGDDLQLCVSDDPVLLSATPGGGEWSTPPEAVMDGLAFLPAASGEGLYTFVYELTDAQGCTGRDSMRIEVSGNVQIGFTSDAQICEGLPLSFEASTDSILLLWDFGDGQTGSGVSVTHTYAQAGLYTVSLTPSDPSLTCLLPSTQDIEVLPQPQPQLALSVQSGCEPLEVSFQNAGSVAVESWQWDFGNGLIFNGSQPPAYLTYETVEHDTTTYVITLTGSNGCGQAEVSQSLTVYPLPVADFGMALDTGCASVSVAFLDGSYGGPQNWQWDFGNGTAYAGAQPPEQLFYGDTIPVSYTVSLTVSNACGSDLSEAEFTVYPEEVQAFFNLSNQQGCAPFTVELEDFSTPGTVVSWEFSDGGTAQGPQVSHTFAEPGVYGIWLFATNACAADSAYGEITVLDAPDLAFAADQPACAGKAVQFENLSQNAVGSYFVFPDGDTSYANNPYHLFEQPGTYEVELYAQHPLTGCEASLSQFVTVHALPQPQFSAEVQSGCMPLEVQFINQSQGAGFYQWNFGDGAVSVEEQPSYTYTDAGQYPVYLVAVSDEGCADTLLNLTVDVWPRPEANFDLSYDEDACGLPLNVQALDLSTGSDAYTWMLDGQLISSQASPSFDIAYAGNHLVSLQVSNVYGCEDAHSEELETFAQPISDFALEDAEGCAPLTVSPVNYSVDGDAWFWDFGDGTVSTDFSPEHIYEQAGSYDVSLVVSYADHCFDTLTLSAGVEVWPQPEAVIEWSLDPAGEPAGSVLFSSLSANAQHLKWFFNDGSTSVDSVTVHRFLEPGPVQVALLVWSDAGCVDTAYVEFTPPAFGSLYVPNALYPRPEPGGGSAVEGTALFKPRGFNLKEYRLQIFSTYGQLLWESTKLTEDGQPAEGWDGTYQGKLLPQDTYVWKIEAIFKDNRPWPGEKGDDGRYHTKGKVFLVR